MERQPGDQKITRFEPMHPDAFDGSLNSIQFIRGKSASDIDALQLRNSARLIPVRYKDIGIAIDEAPVRCAEDSRLDLRRDCLVACPL